jgi:hypothetical protein
MVEVGLGGQGHRIAADRGDHVGLGGHQLGHHGGDLVVTAIGPAHVDGDVLAVDIASGLEALAKGLQQMGVGGVGAAAQIADARQGGGLCATDGGKRRRCAGQSQKMPPLHSSSASIAPSPVGWRFPPDFNVRHNHT